MGKTKAAAQWMSLIVASLVTMGLVVASASHADSRTATGVGPLDSISVRPVNGPGGTEVRVRGSVAPGNCPGGVQIYFTDQAGANTLLGSGPGGTIDITANIPGGSALGLGQIRAVRHVLRFFPPRPRCVPVQAIQTPFTVTNSPGIFGFSPRKGFVGTVVTITGIRFTGATAVKFNGTQSVFSVDSDSQITATVPIGATTGPIEIDVPSGLQTEKAISGPDFVVCSLFC
jgi:hypothetical protein